MPQKALRACIAALKSLTTKLHMNALLLPLFVPILLTKCWAWMAFSWEEKLVAPLIAAPNGGMRK
jgi:hypothetical protein